MAAKTSLFEAVQSYTRSKEWSERAKDDLELAVQTHQQDIPGLIERTGHFTAKLREIQAELIQSGKRIQRYRLEDHLAAEEITEFNKLLDIVGPFYPVEVLPIQKGVIFRAGNNIYNNPNYIHDGVGLGLFFMGAGIGIAAIALNAEKNLEGAKYLIMGFAGVFEIMGICLLSPFEYKNPFHSFAQDLERRAASISKHLQTNE